MRTRALHICGIDLIFHGSGAWKIIEVNDSPVGLIEADQLSRSAAGNALFGESLIDNLSGALARRVVNGAVGLLLPERYRIQDLEGAWNGNLMLAPEAVAKVALFESDRMLLDDFNALAEGLRALGISSVFLDIESIFRDGELLLSASGQRLDVLFRKAYFPKQSSISHCVNDLRSINVCRDKYRANEILLNVLGPAHVPKTALADWGAHEERMSEILSTSKYAITKPNYGYASLDVMRWDSAEFKAKRVTVVPEVSIGSQMILQEWLEPPLVNRNSFSYYYDVRIYTIEGEPIGGFARCAAGPVDSPVDRLCPKSALTWLTTWGRRLPLAVSECPNTDAVVIPRMQLAPLMDISRSTTFALDAVAADLEYGKAVTSLPDAYGQYRNQLQYRIPLLCAR